LITLFVVYILVLLAKTVAWLVKKYLFTGKSSEVTGHLAGVAKR